MKYNIQVYEINLNDVIEQYMFNIYVCTRIHITHKIIKKWLIDKQTKYLINFLIL